MRRDDALALVNAEVRTKNTIKHMLAAEAAMGAVARCLGADEETWALAGLLHDLDYERTKDEPDRHGVLTAEMLAPYALPAEVTEAVLAHNRRKEAAADIERALLAVDPATGFIVAAALMHPAKTLAACDVPFLMKRFREKRFAAGANREQMATCETLGVTLEEFLGLCLAAMQGIAGDLGL